MSIESTEPLTFISLTLWMIWLLPFFVLPANKERMNNEEASLGSHFWETLLH